MLQRQKLLFLDHLGVSKSQTQKMQWHFALETIFIFENKSEFLCLVEIKKKKKKQNSVTVQ